jgi:hypothetical protein
MMKKTRFKKSHDTVPLRSYKIYLFFKIQSVHVSFGREWIPNVSDQGLVNCRSPGPCNSKWDMQCGEGNSSILLWVNISMSSKI